MAPSCSSARARTSAEASPHRARGLKLDTYKAKWRLVTRVLGPGQLHAEIRPTEPRIGLCLVNRGIGPAIITDIVVSVDGQVLPTAASGEVAGRQLLSRLGLANSGAQCTFPLAGMVVGAGEESWVLSYTREHWHQDNSRLDRIEDAIMRLDMEGRYQSFAEEGWPFRLWALPYAQRVSLLGPG